MNSEQAFDLSRKIEDTLVARNPRGMQQVQSVLQPGYVLRAAEFLRDISGHVLIGTGFPVVKTFETDGPVGAIALYDTLLALGAKPIIVCGPPISEVLSNNYHVHEIRIGPHTEREAEARSALDKYQPQALISIERPGMAADGEYYNMRGESISQYTACFDSFFSSCSCPTIAIGDGGNEIGMGKVSEVLKKLDIVPAQTGCDELIVADVSNWGAYGIISFLSVWNNTDFLAEIDPMKTLRFISELGSVDGVTRVNQLTEDGLDPSEGESVIQQLRNLCGFGV